MRVVQIGLGARGRTWARVLREIGVTVVASADPSDDALAWARDAYPDCPVYADFRDAIRAHAADAAAVITPPIGRADVLLPLFDAGLHVVSEKPLETNLVEATRIVRAAERSGRQLSVCLNFRYLEVTRALRARVLGPRGAILYGTFLYHINRDGRRPGLNRFPLTMDDPMLLEQSIHHIDLIRHVYDAEIESVAAEIFNPAESMYRGDATVSAIFQMDRGIRASYLGSWVTGTNVRAFEWRTDCERGALVQRALFGDLYEGDRTGPLHAVPVPEVEPFVTDTIGYARAAFAALAAGTPVPCSGADHLRSLASTIACRRSSDDGEAIHPADLIAEADAALTAAS
ncbi:MAG: Gfo/Idh/MocA family oxidoreductase [Armatimonadetes bacterium]|nr:Gfo/Idh/MocA family oxidoreductase [Armatimonadota bacterium]